MKIEGHYEGNELVSGISKLIKLLQWVEKYLKQQRNIYDAAVRGLAYKQKQWELSTKKSFDSVANCKYLWYDLQEPTRATTKKVLRADWSKGMTADSDIQEIPLSSVPIVFSSAKQIQKY